MNSNKLIFVQIASYRDPELVKTLDSLFNNAKHPENLRIGIVWQKDETESLEHFTNHPQIKVIEIHYSESKGVCWARSKLKDLYNGEEYTLHLDSHHRFIQDWDKECIYMLKELQKKGYPKPLITSYLPSFNPETGDKVELPWKLAFQRFLPEGPAFPVPHTMDNFKSLVEPVRGRLYSGHFGFTLGQFCKEVPHDPNLYFHGEEPSIAVRAFTWGYDIFHPHFVLGWHEYTRQGKKKHWDDNPWVDENKGSFLRYRKLFSMDGETYIPEEFGEYGLGNVRTLEEYTKYSGIDFTNKKVQQYALDDKEPPGPSFESEQEYKDSFLNYYKYVINLHDGDINKDVDYDFWAIAIKDENKKDIVRLDISEEEIKDVLAKKSGDWYHVWKEWVNSAKPKYWAVWPHSKTKGWLNLIERTI
jgi:hypothetical protein